MDPEGGLENRSRKRDAVAAAPGTRIVRDGRAGRRSPATGTNISGRGPMELTTEQLAEFDAVLRRRQQELNADVTDRLERTSDVQTLSGTVGDPGDESVAYMMTDLNLAEATRDVNELRAVEASLARIAAGDYGVCSDCGNEIAYDRLKAYPTAVRCVTCQSQHEKVYASQGTPSL